ncbi:MAG: family 10 glycosylhydrolase, partial [Lentisphaeria bacterium]|nr:family 10 glycosylhydrolase [Lentisphaeria bacterium]
RQFRRDTITSLVAEMATALRRARPGARLSAAVFSNWASCRDTVGQDWVAWARSGSVDFLCPMNYHDEAGAQRDDVRRQMACLRGLPTALYPGIGMSTGDLDALGVLRQVNTARAAGARGFVLFELNRREAVEVLPRLAAALRPGSGAGAGDPVPAIP